MTRGMGVLLLPSLVACGSSAPVTASIGEAVSLGPYTLAVKDVSTLRLPEDQLGLAIFVELRVEDREAVFARSTDDRVRGRNELFRQVRLIDGEGRTQRIVGRVSDESYRRHVGSYGDPVGGFRMLSRMQENPPSVEEREPWVLLTTIPRSSHGYSLSLRNRSPREDQPGRVIVPLGL